MLLYNYFIDTYVLHRSLEISIFSSHNLTFYPAFVTKHQLAIWSDYELIIINTTDKLAKTFKILAHN